MSAVRDQCGDDGGSQELVRRYLDGTLETAETATLCERLLEDSRTVGALIQAALTDESLVEHYKRERAESNQRKCEESLRMCLLAFIRRGSEAPFVADRDVCLRRPGSLLKRNLRRSLAVGALAASFLAAAAWFVSRPRDIAMVTKLVGARMSDGQELYVGTRIHEGQRLEVAVGFVELTFDRGTVVAIKGPADFQVVNDLLAASRRGRIMVDVGERSTGFTVETPSAQIVDWGTKFGVGVDGEETNIVVFDGIVDLHARGAGSGLQKPKRLTQGEGLHVSRSGDLHRIVSVDDSEFPSPRLEDLTSTFAPVIASVKDNVRDGATHKCYRVNYGRLNEDVQAYVDRSHQWNGLTPEGLPRFLVGADYVMPFNEDKRVHDLHVTVTLARHANLYVFYDSRAATPQWLADKFKDTEIEIGLDEGPSAALPDWSTGMGPGESVDTPFRVWKYEAKAGESVDLGPRRDKDSTNVTGAMYGIAATAFSN